MPRLRPSRMNFRVRTPAAMSSAVGRRSTMQGMANHARSAIRLRFTALFQYSSNLREVERRFDRMQWKALRHWGGIVRKTAQNQLKRRKSMHQRISDRKKKGKEITESWVNKQYKFAVSAPGKPPFYHGPTKQTIRNIRYDIDKRTRRVLVGPLRFAKPGLATKVMEHGGTVKVAPLLSKRRFKVTRRIKERSFTRRALHIVRKRPEYMAILKDAL